MIPHCLGRVRQDQKKQTMFPLGEWVPERQWALPMLRVQLVRGHPPIQADLMNLIEWATRSAQPKLRHQPVGMVVGFLVSDRDLLCS
jgi:hypothetical protein